MPAQVQAIFLSFPLNRELFYKARKILLRNLTGSGAFRSGNPKVQKLVERIEADACLYDDVMSLQARR